MLQNIQFLKHYNTKGSFRLVTGHFGITVDCVSGNIGNFLYLCRNATIYCRLQHSVGSLKLGMSKQLQDPIYGLYKRGKLIAHYN